ncbi:MAG: cysteine desulfurase [Limnochordaceae bacterium]|nr:cysteine desulfurase [Limnochordaceae bacterium]
MDSFARGNPPGTPDAPEVYLDNSATTPPLPEVVRAMLTVLQEEYGNPSSLHRRGRMAAQILRYSRQSVADLLRVDPDEIVFTSGGTEANNLALRGVAELAAGSHRFVHDRPHLITTAIEHPSILEPARYLEQHGWDVTYLPVDREGLIDVDQLAAACRPTTVLVSTMWVNNEIGSIQPLDEIGATLRRLREEYRAADRAASSGSEVRAYPYWHVDAVQAVGKLVVEPLRLGIDLLTVSGHKIHGPKGVGALFIRKGVRIAPLLLGGGQEEGLRSGTENLPGIAGMGEACHLARGLLATLPAQLWTLRERLWQGIAAAIPQAYRHGPSDPSRVAPHILSVGFPGTKGEVLVRYLSDRGVATATGSACHSRNPSPSHVLTAIHLPPAEAEGTLRFSLSIQNTAEQVDRTVKVLKEAVAEVRELAGWRSA